MKILNVKSIFSPSPVILFKPLYPLLFQLFLLTNQMLKTNIRGVLRNIFIYSPAFWRWRHKIIGFTGFVGAFFVAGRSLKKFLFFYAVDFDAACQIPLPPPQNPLPGTPASTSQNSSISIPGVDFGPLLIICAYLGTLLARTLLGHVSQSVYVQFHVPLPIHYYVEIQPPVVHGVLTLVHLEPRREEIG